MKKWTEHLQAKKIPRETTDKISKLDIGDDDGSLLSTYAIEDKINEIIDVINTQLKNIGEEGKMIICKRCEKQFHKGEKKYLNGVHWHCLAHDEQMEATIMDMVKTERCGHKNTHTVKFCTDCGKRVK